MGKKSRMPIHYPDSSLPVLDDEEQTECGCGAPVYSDGLCSECYDAADQFVDDAEEGE